MDPALEEAVRLGPADREIEAAALVAPEVELPTDLRVVATFRDVITGRVRVDRVADVRRHPAIRSLKAPRVVGPAEAILGALADPPPPRGVAGATGSGCVLAFLDWGCDFAHPNLREPDGRTRLRAIWDQRGPGDGNRWGYGRVLDRGRIDGALRTPDPYAALRYRLGEAAQHGTHVMDIAAGNGCLPGSARGVAPEAELVFVHLSTGIRTGNGDLGDSVRILEALDFVRTVAGGDPFVVNMSLGRTAGDHTGRSCVERGMDALLEEAPGRCIVQSAGNYFGKRLHAAGRLGPGRGHALEWVIEPGDPSLNELELWYPGPDRLSIELRGPGGVGRLRLALGQRAAVEVDGTPVGFAYHRECDPLNGDHHVDVFLEPRAPAGTWEVRLVGEDVVDGRWHAWIERDPAGPGSQSRFRSDVATDDVTVGSIATARRPLVVGAIDGATGLPAPFSSRGPCRDGRPTPSVVAPGVGILAARSTPPGAAPGSGGLIEMSGTSMASPRVAGAVACLFGKAPRPLNVAETRLLVLGTATPLEADPMRTGAGQLDTEAALAALQCMFKERTEAMPRRSAGGWEPQSSWSDAGTSELDQEMEAALGPMGAYDVVGWPGAPLQAPVREGDILIRSAPGRSRPLVARMASYEIQSSTLFPPGAEAEGDGPGVYAEAYERTPTGWSRAPAYRMVAGPNRVVRPGQIVIRPIAGPVRPGIPYMPAARPWTAAPPPAPPAAEEPADPGSLEPGPDDGDDREDDPTKLEAGSPLSDGKLCDALTTRMDSFSGQMPDPGDSGAYNVLPTPGGMVRGAGWSGHVGAWFGRMKSKLAAGGAAQYRAHAERVTSTAREFRRIVLGQGRLLLEQTERSGFARTIRNFNTSHGSAVIQLVNQYVNESRRVREGYALLKAFVDELDATKQDLVAVHDRYQAFLKEQTRESVEGEKKKLLDEAAEISGLVTKFLGTLSAAPAAPVDAMAVLKLLGGEPVSSIVTLAFGPDPAKLGVLEARLEELDRGIQEHKDRAFTASIKGVRLRLEAAETRAQDAARTILDHKLQTLQAVGQLAGLEDEGPGLQFFHALRDHQKSVAASGAALNDALNGYDRWLRGDPADADLLLTHIRVDIEHVRRNDLDRDGQWGAWARAAAAWLSERFIPWFRPEDREVAKCLKAFRELRHLSVVNEAVNRVIEATGGTRERELGKYLL